MPISAQAAVALLNHALPHFTAMYAVASDGARMFIDSATDTYYIEAPRGYTRAGLTLTLIAVERHGYVPIPIDEDPGYFNELDGSHRIYLVQTVPAFATYTPYR